MRIPVAKEVVAPLALLMLVGIILLLYLPWLGLVTLVVAALVAAFFRDPVRVPAYGPGDFISPADGRVVAVERVAEDQYIKGAALRVGVFMSLLNVHINYSPVTGRVAYMRYSPGRFAPANSRKAPLENESNAIGIAGPSCRIMVKQIAGIIARRIVCDCSLGTSLSAGQKIGLIKFGSRVDIYLPPHCRLFVEIGSRVRGGETILGTVADEKDIPCS
ncbi:MAG: phosphatidylserine decarboxylase [Candidatus Tritonobacter lacicola]|nr:phosphatidylserine decarboxylase [Candidatus Tritonobacter lacicola]